MNEHSYIIVHLATKKLAFAQLCILKRCGVPHVQVTRRGVNRFADRRIWPLLSPRLRILATY